MSRPSQAKSFAAAAGQLIGQSLQTVGASFRQVLQPFQGQSFIV